jgi:hypothetical protein
MDNVPINAECPYYWAADSSQTENFTYYSNSPFNYPTHVAPPPPSYSVPPPNYGNYNYSNESYFPVPPPDSDTTYPVATVTSYCSYEYQNRTSNQESQDYYASNYSQVQSTNYNYNWNSKSPYQTECKTDTNKWGPENSSWSTQTSVNNSNLMSKNVSTEIRHKPLGNDLRRSNSPDNRFHPNKFNNRRKYEDYSSRSRGRSKERRNSRERFYKRRSRSLDKKSYMSNNFFNNHCLTRSERSKSGSKRSESRSRSKRSESRSRNRRSMSRSRSKRRSRSQESHSSMQSIRTNNHLKHKSLSEREMLLEKYRYMLYNFFNNMFYLLNQ